MGQVQPNRNTLNGFLSQVVTQQGPPQRLEDGTLQYPGGTRVSDRGGSYYVGVPNMHTGANGQQFQWGYGIHTFDKAGNRLPSSPSR